MNVREVERWRGGEGENGKKEEESREMKCRISTTALKEKGVKVKQE